MKEIIFVLGSVLLLNTVVVHANQGIATLTVRLDTLKKDGTDPVCKMKVKAGNTRTAVYEKTMYGFCSESCRKKFAIEPKKYIKK
jgi:YHS domain-containing protein